MSKAIHTTEGELTLSRSATAEEFYCGQCKSQKKAKAKATRVLADGRADVICNGCYGNILSRQPNDG